MNTDLMEFEANFSVLDRYGTYVTKEEYITDPAIGRDKEIKQLILVLLTPEKSAILIGKPGIGKTAIVEGLAYRIQKNNVPEDLKGYDIINIKTASLLGTMPSGESKVQKMIDELKKKEKLILFIDEIHMLIGATDSSSLDFANIFKEGLGRGSIKVIGATTTEEYERYILRDKAFTRRFQKIDVPEPSKEETVKIMMGTLPKFEKQTGRKMKYTPFIQQKIMSFIVDITSEYKRVYSLGSRYPDVSLTLLKQAFSYTVYDNRQYMDIFDVRTAIENSKNIYPDVIKKELPNFDKEFNDIILEEKGEKPVEEWRKDNTPTRSELEGNSPETANSVNVTNGNIDEDDDDDDGEAIDDQMDDNMRQQVAEEQKQREAQTEAQTQTKVIKPATIIGGPPKKQRNHKYPRGAAGRAAAAMNSGQRGNNIDPNIEMLEKLNERPGFVDKLSIRDSRPIQSLVNRGRVARIGDTSMSSGYFDKLDSNSSFGEIDDLLLSSNVESLKETRHQNNNMPRQFVETDEIKPGVNDQFLLGRPIESTLIPRQEEDNEVRTYRSNRRNNEGRQMWDEGFNRPARQNMNSQNFDKYNNYFHQDNDYQNNNNNGRNNNGYDPGMDMLMGNPNNNRPEYQDDFGRMAPRPVNNRNNNRNNNNNQFMGPNQGFNNNGFDDPYMQGNNMGPNNGYDNMMNNNQMMNNQFDDPLMGPLNGGSNNSNGRFLGGPQQQPEDEGESLFGAPMYSSNKKQDKFANIPNIYSSNDNQMNNGGYNQQQNNQFDDPLLGSIGENDFNLSSNMPNMNGGGMPNNNMNMGGPMMGAGPQQGPGGMPGFGIGGPQQQAPANNSITDKLMNPNGFNASLNNDGFDPAMGPIGSSSSNLPPPPPGFGPPVDNQSGFGGPMMGPGPQGFNNNGFGGMPNNNMNMGGPMGGQFLDNPMNQQAEKESLFGAPMYSDTPNNQPEQNEVDIYGQLISDNMRIKNGKIVDEFPTFDKIDNLSHMKSVINDVRDGDNGGNNGGGKPMMGPPSMNTNQLMGGNQGMRPGFNNNMNNNMNGGGQKSWTFVNPNQPDPNQNPMGQVPVSPFQNNILDAVKSNEPEPVQQQPQVSGSTQGEFVNLTDLNSGKIKEEDTTKYMNPQVEEQPKPTVDLNLETNAREEDENQFDDFFE